MHINKTKKTTNNNIIITTLLIPLLISCTTTTHRDRHLTTSLKLQNKVLNSILNGSLKPSVQQKENLNSNVASKENHILRGVSAVIKSNNEIINKLKPNEGKESVCGKNERTDN